MKKLLAIVLAVLIIAACSVTAFAETTNVSYNVDPSYTVSIPAAVTLGDAAVTADITASDVILEGGKQVVVELTSASNTASGSTFNAKNGDSTVTYTITGDEAIAVGDTVATFTANGSKTLTFSAADKSAATVAGAHTETLTFEISVEDAVKVETLLTTITATGQTTYGQSVEGVVTVTLANIDAYIQQYGWLWNGTITVEPVEGYTITKCRFIQNNKTPLDDDLAPFSIVMNRDSEDDLCSVITSTGKKGSWEMDGVTSIEVYGYEN